MSVVFLFEIACYGFNYTASYINVISYIRIDIYDSVFFAGRNGWHEI